MLVAHMAGALFCLALESVGTLSYATVRAGKSNAGSAIDVTGLFKSHNCAPTTKKAVDFCRWPFAASAVMWLC